MERSGGCPNHRRLPRTALPGAGGLQPEPVRIAPRQLQVAPPTGHYNGAPFAANKDGSGGDGDNNNGKRPPQGGGEGTTSVVVREQDRFMPIANVIRIMRRVLPTHAKIADDAKETIQECVSEYISFVTSEANERCQQEQRKTITAEDLLWAMTKLGFDDYVEPLTLYLQRYRELEGASSLRAGEALLMTTPSPLKRASDGAVTGLYGVGPPAPPYHVPIAPPHHHYFYAPQQAPPPLPHPPPHLPGAAPVFFPPGAGGGTGSSSATTAGGGLMPRVSYYYRDMAGGSSQAGSSSSQAPQHPSDHGFDPFAPYNRSA